jgi:serine/threonine protein phosphatase 1
MALTSRPASRPVAAKLPEGVRIYAVADIHGRADLLDRLLALIDSDLAANPVTTPLQVFLGDYIDRGPASREVLDRLVDRARMQGTVFLKGNHEVLALEFLADPAMLDEWRQYGGLPTLASYGLRPFLRSDKTEPAELCQAWAQALPEAHYNFLCSLALSFTCGDFFFVHAGVRPGIPLRTQNAQDLIWIRDDFLGYEGDLGKLVVHGHTPVLKPDLRSNRINIDTGAYATGRLTCLVIEGEELRFL